MAGAALVLLGGCSQTNTAGSRGYVRVFQVAQGEPAVDVFANNTLIAQDVAFGSTTNYTYLRTGTYTLKVYQTGTTAAIGSVVGGLDNNQQSTVLVSDYPAAGTVTLLTDANQPPSMGNFSIRFINEIPTTAGDIYFLANVDSSSNTAVQAALNAATPTLADVAFGEVSSYITVPGGNYTIVFTATGTKTAAFINPLTTYTDGYAMTMVLIPSPFGTTPYQLLTVNDVTP